MIINYSDKSVLKGKKSIFLAGPTPRSLDVETWRKEAISILNELGFDGIVYVPELEVDNRTFNYDNQVWWEREALYNASTIIFWIPRSAQLPAYTTNLEYGYWIAKNSDKCLYGRPDDSERNKYLDWLYHTETGRTPINNLKELLKNAVKLANENKNKMDFDSYELNIITNMLKKYPEITALVGNVEFTPESFGMDGDKPTYGRLLFKDTEPDQLKEFDRTILSVLLYFYIKENRYDKFVEQQTGVNRLSKETFNEIREFILSNFDTPEKENLLLYYIVINDLGKSKRMVDAIKDKGVETVDHDLILNYLLQYNMLPSLNSFSDESKNSLINVLSNGINMGQFIQGECVDYSFNRLQNLTTFEKMLMLAEAMLDIGGVLGHINNQNGSAVLNQSTADNFITASKLLSSCEDCARLFDEFLINKSNKMGLQIQDSNIRRTVTRLCLMMRLSNLDDIKIVENVILDNIEQYQTLIYEFNQSGYNNQPAILLYYSPAMLNNACSYFKKNNSENPISDALKSCLPFMQSVMLNARVNMNNQGNGIFTIMLRDAAMAVIEDPEELNSFELNVLGQDEAQVQRKLKK